MLGSAHISKRFGLHPQDVPEVAAVWHQGSSPFDALPTPLDWKLGKKGQSR
jgi:hypothetical protein